LALRRSEDQVVALEKKLITQASETRTALLALADTETQLGEVNRNIANLTAKLQSANKTKEVLSLELSAQRKKMAQLQAPKEEQSLWQRLKWW
jgi:regulator of replication initiation timing